MKSVVVPRGSKDHCRSVEADDWEDLLNKNDKFGIVVLCKGATKDDFKTIFSDRGPLPLIAERLQALRLLSIRTVGGYIRRLIIWRNDARGCDERSDWNRFGDHKFPVCRFS